MLRLAHGSLTRPPLRPNGAPECRYGWSAPRVFAACSAARRMVRVLPPAPRPLHRPRVRPATGPAPHHTPSRPGNPSASPWISGRRPRSRVAGGEGGPATPPPEPNARARFKFPYLNYSRNRISSIRSMNGPRQNVKSKGLCFWACLFRYVDHSPTCQRFTANFSVNRSVTFTVLR